MEKKKAREQQLVNEEENSFCFVFFYYLTIVCLFGSRLTLQDRANLQSHTHYKKKNIIFVRETNTNT